VDAEARPYVLGGWLGRDRTRSIIGRIPFVAVDDVDKGGGVVCPARLPDGLPRPDGAALRSLVSIPAGIDRMPLLPFLALTLAGSLAWNAVLVLAGYFLGESWPLVEQYAGVLQGVVIAATVALVALFVVGKVRKARSKVNA
jgi:hypothetical protein